MRELSEDETNVIEAALDLVTAWEGSKYGPMQHEIKRAESSLITAATDLQANNDGAWRRPA